MGSASSKKKYTQAAGLEPILTVIMLGTAGVGKSTVQKQVARSFGDGESAHQRAAAVIHVKDVLVRVTLDVCNMIADSATNNESRENGEDDPCNVLFTNVEELQDISNSHNVMPPSIAKVLQSIWSDPLFEKEYAFQRVNVENKEFAMKLDTADMFSGRIGELFETDFALASEEFIQLRQPTTGVQKTVGKYNKKAFELLDVGGQAHFQEEWPAIISAAKASPKALAIIYIVSLDDCGHFEKGVGWRQGRAVHSCTKSELESATALQEKSQSKCSLVASLDNFYEHVDSELLAHPLSVPIILLLNKVDLFRKSLLENPAKFHQSFNDEKHKSPEESQADYEDRCIRAVRKKFERRYKRSLHNKKDNLGLKWYVTQATDGAMVKKIMEKIVENVTEMNMCATLK